jgi:catechol 2,3-dioxygenase-like lactoylglutathione lyase family enzyme
MSIKMAAPLEVGIGCGNLPVLRRFYEEILGFSFVSEIVVPADKAASSHLSADGYTVVRLQTSYGERIKLLASNTLPAKRTPGAYILDNAGATYLTFIIDNLDAAIKRLLAAGITFMTGEKRVEVRPGVYLAFCRDPEGNVLELVQYQDIATYRADLAGGD